MKVCLSFDDGRKDAFDAYKILVTYGLTASFHITTGFIDGSFKTDAFGNQRKPLTIDELKQMHFNGMDVSSHGDKHIMEYQDFRLSYEKLSKWNLIENRVGFSVPNSQFSDSELKEFVRANQDVLSYVRVGRSKKCYSLYSKIHYALYHIIHNQFSFNEFNKNNLIFSVDRYNLNSLVIKRDTKVVNLIRFIAKNKNKDAILILMLHSVVDNPINDWEYSTSEFTKLVNYLSKNVEVINLKDVVKDGQ